MTSVSPWESAERFVVPEHTQEQTRRAAYEVSVEFILPEPPTPSGTIATLEETQELLRAAQQVLFLPHFPASDHIFRGEANTKDPNQGYASVRTGIVKGPNFRLNVVNNFNVGSTTVYLYPPSLRDMIFADLRLDDLNVDSAVANWLSEEVLVPVRTELMTMPVGVGE